MTFSHHQFRCTFFHSPVSHVVYFYLLLPCFRIIDYTPTSLLNFKLPFVQCIAARFCHLQTCLCNVCGIASPSSRSNWHHGTMGAKATKNSIAFGKSTSQRIYPKPHTP